MQLGVEGLAIRSGHHKVKLEPNKVTKIKAKCWRKYWWFQLAWSGLVRHAMNLRRALTRAVLG